MRRAVEAAGIGTAAVVVLAFFFLAPVVFWFNEYPPIVGQRTPANAMPVYRSLGCATVGIGDLYAPSWFGFSFGCQPPYILLR